MSRTKRETKKMPIKIVQAPSKPRTKLVEKMSPEELRVLGRKMGKMIVAGRTRAEIEKEFGEQFRIVRHLCHPYRDEKGRPQTAPKTKKKDEVESSDEEDEEEDEEAEDEEAEEEEADDEEE